MQRLNLVTADYVEDECDIGQAEENAAKNRYPDVIARKCIKTFINVNIVLISWQGRIQGEGLGGGGSRDLSQIFHRGVLCKPNFPL